MQAVLDVIKRVVDRLADRVIPDHILEIAARLRIAPRTATRARAGTTTVEPSSLFVALAFD
jgi:hypothetical protein